MIRTRFAPSPTGDLHLGGAWIALAAWIAARRAGGAFVLRVEDLDPPRVVAGAAVRLLDDLRWLGFDWDEGPDVGGPSAPYAQSARFDRYEAAIAALDARDLVYRCDCSRSEIASVASAPHDGDEIIYSGACRDRAATRPFKRAPALRVRVPENAVSFVDGARGYFSQRLRREVGDFVLRRADGVFAYQLAVVVDDCAMNITDVHRGADLLASTPRQIFLAEALGASAPRYTHLPLVVASDGARLAKRTPGARIRHLRDIGLPAERIIGALAHGLGLAPDDDPRSIREVAALGFVAPWPREAWPIPPSWTS